jgi:hypothetical protein
MKLAKSLGKVREAESEEDKQGIEEGRRQS